MCLFAVIFCLARLPVEARNLQFEQITTEDGLSQSAVMVIAQDDRGYIWIGTQEGLNRYDGYEFKVFEHDASDKNSLPDDWVLSLLVDHKGRLWVGTNDGGLSRYDADKDNFVNYQHIPIRALYQLQQLIDHLTSDSIIINADVVLFQGDRDPVVDPASLETLDKLIIAENKTLITLDSDIHGVIYVFHGAGVGGELP